MAHNSWVPLSDPEALHEISDGALENRFALPSGVDAERIEINVDRVTRLTQFAGAKQLVIASANLRYQQPDIDDTKGVSGGLAPIKGLKKRPLKFVSQATYDDTNNPMKESSFYEWLFPNIGVDHIGEYSRLEAYKADSLLLQLDRAGLQDAVVDDPNNKKSFLDEASWSRALDTAIKRGLTLAANERYVNGNVFQSIVDPFTSILWYEFLFQYLITGDRQILAGFAAGAKAVQLLLGTHRVIRGDAQLRDYNWTLQILSTVRTDRIALTALTSAIGGKIVRYAH